MAKEHRTSDLSFQMLPRWSGRRESVHNEDNGAVGWELTGWKQKKFMGGVVFFPFFLNITDGEKNFTVLMQSVLIRHRQRSMSNKDSQSNEEEISRETFQTTKPTGDGKITECEKRCDKWGNALRNKKASESLNFACCLALRLTARFSQPHTPPPFPRDREMEAEEPGHNSRVDSIRKRRQRAHFEAHDLCAKLAVAEKAAFGGNLWRNRTYLKS